jgi:hypothetical protein
VNAACNLKSAGLWHDQSWLLWPVRNVPQNSRTWLPLPEVARVEGKRKLFVITAFETRRPRGPLWCAFAIALASAAHVSGASQTFQIDAAQSRTTIHVGKAGVFSFVAGHSHDVAGPIESGTVEVDPAAPEGARIRLAIAASELRVSAAGEPEGDAPKVQEAMDGAKVLDVAR